MADGTLKVGTITTSSGSGNITIGSGVTLQSNVPAFEVDTDSIYNTTDYKATIPSGKDGKYFVYVQGQCQGDGTTGEILDTNMQIYKNGTSITRTTFGGDTNATADRNTFLTTYTVLDLAAGDYLEIYALINSVSGTTSLSNAFSSTQIQSRFGAYRIGA
jgi:hypothetical protein